MTLEERMRAAKAARSALAKSRAEKTAQLELEAAVEAEERALKDEQALACAEDEIGPVGKKICTVPTDLGIVILKKPHPAVYNRFQDKGELTTRALTEFVQPSLVYPKDRFDQILDELPATLALCGNAIAELAGARRVETQGK